MGEYADLDTFEMYDEETDRQRSDKMRISDEHPVMKIKVTMEMEIEVPQIPNFLRRSDGVMMPINSISHESLREIG